MYVLRRFFAAVLLVLFVAIVVTSMGWPWQWLDLRLGTFSTLRDRTPERALALDELPAYTREVASTPAFRRYFTRMVFSDRGEQGTYVGLVTKWEKDRVRIDILNDGGPGLDRYVERLARRLNRIQPATRFVVVDDGPAEVTIEYLSGERYRRAIGDDSVGTTATRYYQGSPGLIEASINIDAGRLTTTGELKAAVIHELTHAIGFNGHFRDESFQRRSVLYYASTITDWSQDDAASIRVLYSSTVQNGMTMPEVEAALREFAAKGNATR